MPEKTLPFNKADIEKVIEDHPTPFYVYDEKSIRKTARRFNQAYSWVPNGFMNFFAVKANPNPSILRILQQEGFGADCSSLPELVLAEKVGIIGENIMFTSNDTPSEEFQKARELGAIINLDDITHIQTLEDSAGIPPLICFRWNPGILRRGNKIIGDPVEAKYGLTTEQIFEAYRIMRDKGVKRFGLHTMVVSNMLNPEYLIGTGRLLFELVVELSKKLGINFEFVNLGGGVGIPYKPEDSPVDLEFVSAGVKRAHDEIIVGNGIRPLRVVMECGRAITGPHGYLVSRVRHVTHKYKDFVGLDATMADLMRPGMYGAYHHITVLGKEDLPRDHKYDVTGSLCENNDKFAVNRILPQIGSGDIVVIHDAGAHGRAMGFQYNGKLRCAELLLRPNGKVMEIRRAETVDDYFATLDFTVLHLLGLPNASPRFKY
jgi:diaminopimelate decarboxylase